MNGKPDSKINLGTGPVDAVEKTVFDAKNATPTE